MFAARLVATTWPLSAARGHVCQSIPDAFSMIEAMCRTLHVAIVTYMGMSHVQLKDGTALQN
jgi:hypothetical protein